MTYQTRRQLKATITRLRERVFELSSAKPPKSYELEKLQRYEAAFDKLWKKHSKPYTSKQPGDYDYGQVWWCSTCRTQWPCETANLVLTVNGSHKLGPMRAPIVGETIVPEGVEPSPGSWMRVQGLVVPKIKPEKSAS